MIHQVHDELRDWSLHLVLWVGDRGFTSVENRAHLQRAGGHVLFGEKLRGVADSTAALARPGRYATVADNLAVKEVWVGDGATRRRFIVCRNLAEAHRDAATRDRQGRSARSRRCGTASPVDQPPRPARRDPPPLQSVSS